MSDITKACRLCRNEGAKTFLCDECFDANQSDDPNALTERRATIAERAAVVDYLRRLYRGTSSDLRDAANGIEKGEHTK